MKYVFVLIASLLIVVGCSHEQDSIKFKYIKEGVIVEQIIPTNFISPAGEIQSVYIDSVKFGYLDSTAYPDNNPDRMKQYVTYKDLDFSKKITEYSPEYYALSMVYNANKAMLYYNSLFDNKIDFNSQITNDNESYKNIDVIFGEIALFTTPKSYYIAPNSNPSLSIPYHEVGHRAFWYLQSNDGLGIKFSHLTVIHMGLLEYFTMSLNNSPIVGEDVLPIKAIRRGDILYKYPLNDSFKLRKTFDMFAESFPEQIADSTSNLAKYINACYATYSDDILDGVYDNHSGAMVLASTLWRIREHVGHEKADKLVAQTILNLNSYMDSRESYYKGDETKLYNRIEWCDVFYGLIMQDKEQNNGENFKTIVDEFKITEYPVENVRI